MKDHNMKEWHKYESGTKDVPEEYMTVEIIRDLNHDIERKYAYWTGKKWMSDEMGPETVVTGVVFWKELSDLPEDLEEVVEQKRQQSLTQPQSTIYYGDEEPPEREEEYNINVKEITDKLKEVDRLSKNKAEKIAKRLKERQLAFNKFLELNDLTNIKGIGKVVEDNIREEFGD